ncbi:MAG: hypothetical protein GYB65_01395, partial [Chloroflexi bacterium]|nr:hypothetical protein [Chloroflexota bacterium]
MTRRTIGYVVMASLILATVISLGATIALGGSAAQGDPTAEQQTLDAAINQLFTQTAAAQSQVGGTLTVEAGLQSALTATWA